MTTFDLASATFAISQKLSAQAQLLAATKELLAARKHYQFASGKLDEARKNGWGKWHGIEPLVCRALDGLWAAQQRLECVTAMQAPKL
jgi:hypothetical protein